MKTILYFQATGKVSAQHKLEGVYAYGRKHDWNVQVIEPGASARRAAELIRFWTPDGAIVECPRLAEGTRRMDQGTPQARRHLRDERSDGSSPIHTK